MSLTPIFDATLADAPRNIWQASNIFPQPTVAKDFAETWRDLGCPATWTPATVPDFTDWSAIRQPIWAAGGMARGDFYHAVIVDRTGKLVHDPHPSQAGVTEVEEFFAVLVPIGGGH